MDGQSQWSWRPGSLPDHPGASALQQLPDVIVQGGPCSPAPAPSVRAGGAVEPRSGMLRPLPSMALGGGCPDGRATYPGDGVPLGVVLSFPTRRRELDPLALLPPDSLPLGRALFHVQLLDLGRESTVPVSGRLYRGRTLAGTARHAPRRPGTESEEQSAGTTCPLRGEGAWAPSALLLCGIAPRLAHGAVKHFVS